MSRLVREALEIAAVLGVVIGITGGCAALMYFSVDLPAERYEQARRADCEARGGSIVENIHGEFVNCVTP